MTIAYPVRLASDGTDHLFDAHDRLLGTVQIRDALNEGHRHGHAGELGERQIELIRQLQERVERCISRGYCRRDDDVSNEAVRKALNAVWAKHNLLHGWTGLDEPGIIADIIAAVRGAT